MSENQSPHNPSAPQSISVSITPTQTAIPLKEETLVEAPELATDDEVNSDSTDNGIQSSASADDEAVEAAVEASDITPNDREHELLGLIRDLNECNDALLAKVSQLEGDLQRATAEAAADVETARAAVQLAQEKMSRQVAQEQASAQQVSQTAQQQVARLVGDLEQTEQALNRQQLVNENLQTELTEAQERITQLEKEGALAAQNHAEEIQARVKADAKNRDLRSRLQRQQRYTLQFKAALEKSLSVGVSSASVTQTAEQSRPVSFNQPTAVSMPRSQRIMPWASANHTSAFQGIDPHLEAMIRRSANPSVAESAGPQQIMSEATQSVAPQTNVSTTNAATTNATAAEWVSPEAEAELWQDLARVMTTETASGQDESGSDKSGAESAQEQVSQNAEKHVVEAPKSEAPKLENVKLQANQAIAKRKGPRLNWLAKMHQSQKTTSATAAQEETASEATDEDKAGKKAAQQVNLNNAALVEALAKTKRQAQADNIPADSAPAGDVTFTEPSPWGPPVETASVETASRESLDDLNLNDQNNASRSVKQPAAASADYLPAIESVNPSSVSPVAKPLQAQKKIGSFASVELPTFPSAKSASFKR
ncbi:MAG: hypothetical protein AAF703_19970 [Cyanobacteria bacterium P01_D01_bin.105]